MQMLAAFLQSIYPSIRQDVLEDYISAWTEVFIPKKRIITAEGEIQKDMFFVMDGVQKSYFLMDGKAHIMAFTYAPSLSAIPESFFNQAPSAYYLETITDSRLLKISHAQHQDFMIRHRDIETLFRIGAEQLYCGLSVRYRELMSNDIETRFRNFANRSSHLLNIIPHKDLASYLRIDPSNFSKLMGKVKILV